MKDVYILFALDEEPGKRCTGEFGHDIIVVYESLEEAKSAASEFMDGRFFDDLLVYRSVVGGEILSSEEVWRWSYGQD
jgi:hypothetical protein